MVQPTYIQGWGDYFNSVNYLPTGQSSYLRHQGQMNPSKRLSRPKGYTQEEKQKNLRKEVKEVKGKEPQHETQSVEGSSELTPEGLGIIPPPKSTHSPKRLHPFLIHPQAPIFPYSRNATDHSLQDPNTSGATIHRKNQSSEASRVVPTTQRQ